MKHKIIHLVLGKANPERMNGVNKVAHNQATSLYEKGVEVEIWGITPDPESETYPRPFPTRLFRSQSLFKPLDPAFIQAVDAMDVPCIFHVHGAFIPDFYRVCRLLHKKGLPFIYTPHGAYNAYAMKKNKWLKRIYFGHFEKKILDRAEGVQFLGKSEFDHSAKLYPQIRRVLIPNGQNLQELEFTYAPILRSSSPVFVFCGRMDSYYKGLDMLLDAFAHYKRNGGKGILWLIGDGPDRTELEKQSAGNNTTDTVEFFGSLYGQEKLNRMSNGDYFVHPSRSEGFPTAVLEAAALRLPVLVSSATNIGEMVDQYNCGIHLSNCNVDTLSRSLTDLEKMYSGNERISMADNARRMVLENYSWSAVADQLLGVYKHAGNR